jgi:hypothetical protein
MINADLWEDARAGIRENLTDMFDDESAVATAWWIWRIRPASSYLRKARRLRGDTKRSAEHQSIQSTSPLLTLPTLSDLYEEHIVALSRWATMGDGLFLLARSGLGESYASDAGTS